MMVAGQVRRDSEDCDGGDCMDKAGELLSGECIHALIDAGEVSQAEVDRRKH